ncbi:hypothetical protein CcCBS67573_g09737 [Chytriomyces confervae]|uniref:Uncharacterized protein n=1 Tax=Chytriomyces confervae TaxID=246404 RepID=A0A507DQJ0_9FUNG|nr:hypothetical protein CcCBS67573_g09737 [Chytriomyces confervae]
MRADVTGADMAAFYITAVMLAVMIITLLLLLAVVFKPMNQKRTIQPSNGGQSRVRKTRHALLEICTVFNLSLLGMILGSAALFSSLLLALAQSHTNWTVKGAVLLESVGGTLFDSCYCIYTWSRSKSLIGESGSVFYWILTVLAVSSPIFFTAQLIAGILIEYNLARIQIYHQVVVATIAGMFLLDVVMLWCFCYFLLKNPAPTTSTGHLNGNKEAQRQWNRTSIIAKYGAFSCGASFLTLAIIIVNVLFPSMNAHANLLCAGSYFATALSAIILLVMKIKLEGGFGKSLFGSTAKSEDGGRTSDRSSNPLNIMMDSLTIHSHEPRVVITKENAKNIVFPRVQRARRRVKEIEASVELEMSKRFEGLSDDQRLSVLQLVEKNGFLRKLNDPKQQQRQNANDSLSILDSPDQEFVIHGYALMQDVELSQRASGADDNINSSDSEKPAKIDLTPREKYARLTKRESQGSNPAVSTVPVDEDNSASRGYEEMKRVTKSLQDWSHTMLASPVNLFDYEKELRQRHERQHRKRDDKIPSSPLSPPETRERNSATVNVYTMQDSSSMQATQGSTEPGATNACGEFEILLNACKPATMESKLSIRLNVSQENNPPLSLIASLKHNLGVDVKARVETIKMEEVKNRNSDFSFSIHSPHLKNRPQASYGNWYLKPESWNEFMLKSGAEKNPKPRKKMGGLVQQKLDKIMITRAKEEAAFQFALAQSYGPQPTLVKPGSASEQSDTFSGADVVGETGKDELGVAGTLGMEETGDGMQQSRQVSRVGSRVFSWRASRLELSLTSKSRSGSVVEASAE